MEYALRLLSIYIYIFYLSLSLSRSFSGGGVTVPRRMQTGFARDLDLGLLDLQLHAATVGDSLVAGDECLGGRGGEGPGGGGKQGGIGTASTVGKYHSTCSIMNVSILNL